MFGIGKKKRPWWDASRRGYVIRETFPYGESTCSYDNNVILSENIFLGMDSRETKRNLNTIILGSERDGIVDFYFKPNLLQANTSYFVIDRAGEMLRSCGSFLRQQGYQIKIFDPERVGISFSYNPFHYICRDKGVASLITHILKNTESLCKNHSTDDPYLEKAEEELLSTIFYYLLNHCAEEEQNFSTVLSMLNAIRADDNGSSISKLGKIMKIVKEKSPDDIAYAAYREFRKNEDDTAAAAVSSCLGRLQIFTDPSVQHLTREDGAASDIVDLAGINKEKTAVFFVIPKGKSEYNFIASMMLYQIVDSLYTEIERNGYPNRLVRFFISDMCQMGYIPEIEKKLATMRLYGISFAMSVDSLKKLDEIYGDGNSKHYRTYEAILGNCDCILFYGTADREAQVLAIERTLDSWYWKVQYNQENSTFEVLKREISITASDRKNVPAKPELSSEVIKKVTEMDPTHCIVWVREFYPFYEEKYDLSTHPNYKYTADADENNAFDVAHMKSAK